VTGTEMEYPNFVGTFLKRKGAVIKGGAPEGLAEAQSTNLMVFGGAGAIDETIQGSLPHVRSGRLYRSL